MTDHNIIWPRRRTMTVINQICIAENTRRCREKWNSVCRDTDWKLCLQIAEQNLRDCLSKAEPINYIIRPPRPQMKDL